MQQPNMMNNVFGVLPKQYCMYFYIIMIIFFIMMILYVLHFLYLLLAKYKSTNAATYYSLISLFIISLLNYFGYRLVYSMCISSLR